MSLDIYCRDDIHNALIAVEHASSQAGGSDEYRRGYEDALMALALLFGCQMAEVTS